MKVKVFFEPPLVIQQRVNKFLKKVNIPDIYKIDTLAFPCFKEGDTDLVCVLIWLKES